ncbi:MAG: alpha/beta hydrolase, partial [Gammaproteobacteria bacterium]|nr:alpha/beta hydrolase [Gammaproteobacteria bacterium]
GGYGLVNNMGGGVSEQSVGGFIAPPNRLLKLHATSNSDYRSALEPRIKAGFAVAPWGMNAGFWESNDLAGISVPAFYLAGDQDSVAGYENGTKAIFDGAVNSDRFLLTFIGAGHNAGAPIPVPEELDNEENIEAAGHYRDQNWANVEMNNIMDHYATAWFDFYLKGINRQQVLEAIPSAYQDRLSIEHKSIGE